MIRKTLRFGKGFRVIPANSRSQAADQWLFVRSGRGAARLEGYDRRGDPLPRGKK